MAKQPPWLMLGPYNIPSPQRRAWLEAIKTAVGATHWRQGDHEPDAFIPHPYIECNAPQQTHTPIRIVLSDETTIFVHVRAGPKDNKDLWVVGIEQAVRRVSEGYSGEQFDWWALIGPDAHSTNLTRLSGQLDLGRISLEPTSDPTQHIDNFRPELLNSGWSPATMWLVSVRGVATGGTWWQAQEGAGRDLRRICALLTVLTGDLWVVRQDPFLQPPDVPAVSMLAAALYGGVEIAAAQPVIGKPRVVGVDAVIPWLSETWNQHETQLVNAFDTFYEARLMEDKHQSFAVVAFVAALTAIGNRINPQGSDRTKFSSAIATAITDPGLVKFVTDHCYGKRSKAGHGSGLFGTESVLGLFASGGLLDPGEHWRGSSLVYRLGLLASEVLGRAASCAHWSAARKTRPPGEELEQSLRFLDAPPEVIASVEVRG